MKPLSWLPIFALAAALGFSAAYLRRLRPHPAPPVADARHAVPPVRRVDAGRTDPPRAAGKPPVATPRPRRARAEELFPYWKSDCVSLRVPGAPAVFSGFHTEPRLWDGTPEATPPTSPANSFRLFFPERAPAETVTGVYSPGELAMAVYAETAGIFPEKAVPGSVYDPGRWKTGYAPGSYGDLLLARRMIAETRKRNKRTHLAAPPSVPNRPASLAWSCCAGAAADAVGRELYPLRPWERLHFFLRQQGDGRRKAAYLAGYAPVMSFGPFVNVGGGDVPAGDRTYIDFYVLPVR